MQYAKWARLSGSLALVGLALLLMPKDSRQYESQSQFGYTPNPNGTKQFLTELGDPMFASAGREAIEKSQQRDTFLYRAAQEAYRERYGQDWVVEKQGIGDCVAWAYSHCAWIAAAQDWKQGLLQEPPLFPCVEAIYGGSRCEARNKTYAGYSDGSYGGAASRWLHDWGVIWRQQYGDLDLGSYSASRSKEWGAWGCGGKGETDLDQTAKDYPVAHIALIKNFEEAAAAIESGFPIAVCSGVGFESRIDDQGFSRKSGRWAHAMCFCAVRYGERPGLLCLNSWGPNWNGPRENRWPEDMPAGSFWVDVPTVNEMLGNWADSFAVGSIEGFKWRDLHHGEWLGEPK